MGLMTRRVSLQSAGWDYNQLAAGLKNTRAVAAPKFDPARAQQAVEKQLAVEPGAWETEGTLFVIEIAFDPNQSVFVEDRYAHDYQKALQVAQTYGDALVVIEGHGDPLGILQAQQKGERTEVLDQMRQVAKNLSLARANSVRSSFIQYSKVHGIHIDPSQFIAIGAAWRGPNSTRRARGMSGRPIAACASSSSRLSQSLPSSSLLGIRRGGGYDAQTDALQDSAARRQHQSAQRRSAFGRGPGGGLVRGDEPHVEARFRGRQRHDRHGATRQCLAQ
jgi:outer membrane protein OmpA-like peptidoglycan-associated protein